MANQQMICANNASSSNFTSSSSAEPPKRYDVFLSFRGEDTRIGFTSYLYYALKQKKVETYIDNRLERGDEISSALMKAIEESDVSIIIFSENYASSKWCLEELSKIMERKKDQEQVVIPVFYRIDPSHVRKQSGSYEQAFANHVGDMRVHKWRVALTEAANLAGWHIQPDRAEPEFIKLIVEDVLKKLNDRYPVELERLFGIEENYAEIESLLEIGSGEGIRIIGIWGMGGIGKTTLARALYTKLSSLFESHCFFNVKEELDKNGLKDSGNILFSKLLEEENPGLNADFNKSRMRRKRVLIVLDDVTTLEQLNYLIIDHNCLGSRSRVIVTTRYKHVLREVDRIYEAKKLNDANSIQLFCANAFCEKHPKEGYEKLLKGVIAYCKGIPLALKVLGKHLHGKGKEVWDSNLKRLERIPHIEIQKVLRLSYDGLDHIHQDIFLDIAFFFKGEYKDRVTEILEACGFYAVEGIQHLIEMALITISYGVIKMHDLIQEMALEIVHEESTNNPGKRSRLCNPEEVCEVLECNTGTDAIEGIRLDVSKIKSLHLNSDSFTKMINLRYLHFYGGNFIDVCDVRDLAFGPWSFSRRLRSLRWQGYCFKSLPSTFYAKMLVELDMSGSSLEKLWDGRRSFDNLKRINLIGSRDLVEIPDLSTAPNLDEIYLGGCERLCQLHPSILSLPKLRVLSLYDCRQIELLELGDTAIHELPSSFSRNRKLCELSLRDCGNLSVVGKNLVDDCGMGCLHDLVLSGCKQLNASKLGIILGGARSLKVLSLSGCDNIRALPDVIKNLSKLKWLFIDGCTELEYVPELPPSLTYILSQNCTSLKSVMNLKKLSSLHHLDLRRSNIEFIELSNLPPFLSYLYAYDCKSLKMVSNFNTIEIRLKELCLSNCCNLEKLPDSIKTFSKLDTLELDECLKLEGLPELPPSLRFLTAINCTSLDPNLTQRQLAEHVKHGILSILKYRLAGILVPDFCILVPGDHVPEWFICTTGTSITIPHLPLSHLRGFVCCHILPSSKYNFHDVYCRITQDGSSEVLGLGYCRGENRSKNFILDHLMIWFFDIRHDHHKIQKNGVNDLCNNISLELGHYCKDSEGVTRKKQMKGCGVFPFYATDLELAGKSKSEWELGLGSSSKDIVGLESNAQSSTMGELLPDLNFPSVYAVDLDLRDKLKLFLCGVIKDIVELESNAQSSHIQKPLPLTDDLNSSFQPETKRRKLSSEPTQ